MVEYQSSKLDVAGSSPVSCSRAGQSPDSVPNTKRNGLIPVWERTLEYRKNSRASQPDLVRTNDYS